MIPWTSIVGAIVSTVLGIWLMARAERNAIARRSIRLRDRSAFTIDDWRRTLPTVSFDMLEQVLPIIGRAIGVPHHYLRPDDSFADELSLKDRFWCLMVDDDTTEHICDYVDAWCGQRPSGNWTTLSDVVLEVWPLTLHEEKTEP